MNRKIKIVSAEEGIQKVLARLWIIQGEVKDLPALLDHPMLAEVLLLIGKNDVKVGICRMATIVRSLTEDFSQRLEVMDAEADR